MEVTFEQKAEMYTDPRIEGIKASCSSRKLVSSHHIPELGINLYN